MVNKVETIRRLEEIADYFYQIYLYEENLEQSLEAKDRYEVIQDTLELLNEQPQWHPFNPLEPDDTGLKDHYFYLVTVKGFKTPMKAKYHDDSPFGFLPPLTGDFDPCDVIAWRELPDNMDEEVTELPS